MNYSAGLMIRAGGEYEAHGRQLRGAAGVVENWVNAIGRE